MNKLPQLEWQNYHAAAEVHDQWFSRYCHRLDYRCKDTKEEECIKAHTHRVSIPKRLSVAMFAAFWQTDSGARPTDS